MNAAPVAGKVYFPREVIAIATVGVSAIDLAISSALFFIIIGIQGVGFSYHLIAMIPIFLVLAIIVLGLGIFLGVLTVFLRDLRYAVPLVLQLLFIATPIMYPPTLLKGKLAIFTRINPFAVVVNSVRQVALAKQWPDWPLLGVHAAIGLAFLFLVLLYTRSVEPRLVDVM
jgi:lipopolysaccharide transport system permease protein